MDLPLAERCHRVFEPLHSMIYFAPELHGGLAAVGLQPGRMCVFAGRVAPMGAVTLGAVAGVFYTFNPVMLSEFIPAAWGLAAPADVVTARYAAAGAALHRLFTKHENRRAQHHAASHGGRNTLPPRRLALPSDEREDAKTGRQIAEDGSPEDLPDRAHRRTGGGPSRCQD